MMPGWTVKQLRDALCGVPDDLVVLVSARSESDEGDTELVGGIYAAAVEPDHLGEEPDVLRLLVSDADEDFETPSTLTLVKS